MFQLRKETDYAIQFLKTLAKYKGESLSLNDMSVMGNISFLFLQKIARKLRQAKIISAAHGAGGGYTLEIPENKLTLRKIIEVMEGKCGLLACSDNNTKCTCGMAESCHLKIKMTKVNKQILKVLDKIKLKDL